MLKNLETIQEIDEFFDSLIHKPNSSFRRATIYGLAYSAQQDQEKKDIYRDIVKSQYRIINNVSIINDEIAIVEAENKQSHEIRFYPIVFDKFHSESCESFDEALVLALSRKYGQVHCAPSMIYNMLRMDLGGVNIVPI